MVNKECIKEHILDLTEKRGPRKTICPSEAAKACDAQNWRSLMVEVRIVAESLRRDGVISIEQQGRQISLDEAKGPIRLRIKEHD
jgi:hypothetical protein